MWAECSGAEPSASWPDAIAGPWRSVCSRSSEELLRRERRSAVEETQYGFNHELMRDVAYGGIPHADRSSKHRRAAEWIESLGRPDDHVELLVDHYLRALEYAPGDDTANRNLATRARLALRDAGDRASALNAFAEATGLYREALRLWPSDDPERPQLLFGYALALHVTGDQQREQLLEEARASSRPATSPLRPRQTRCWRRCGGTSAEETASSNTSNGQ